MCFCQSVCSHGGWVPCDHYPLCIGPQNTWTPPPPRHVQTTSSWTSSNVFNLDLTLQVPFAMDPPPPTHTQLAIKRFPSYLNGFLLMLKSMKQLYTSYLRLSGWLSVSMLSCTGLVRLRGAMWAGEGTCGMAVRWCGRGGIPPDTVCRLSRSRMR